MTSRSDDRNLDLLRATAVLLVLVAHTLNFTVAPESWQPILQLLGNSGVVLFFVHTSTVLMRSLERSETKGLWGWGLAKDFYTRRAFRIYPLAILTVAAVILFHIQREPSDLVFIRPTVPETVANLTLTQNFWGLRSILAPLWSLPYEMEMYVLLPFLFFRVLRLERRGLALLATIGLAVAILYPFALSIRGAWRLSVIDYLPCFLAGVIAYRLAQLTRPRMSYWYWPLTIFAVLLVVSFTHPPMDLGFWRGWIVAFVVGGMMPFVREIPASFISRGSHTIAKYSYGVYLSHLPILDLAVRVMRDEPIAFRLFAGILGFLLLPPILYHSVEQPMIRLGAGLAGRKGSSLASTAPVP